MSCPSLENKCCLLASEICSEPVAAIDRTCNRCGGSTVQNKQTVSLAVYHLGQKKKDLAKAQEVWFYWSSLLELKRNPAFDKELGPAVEKAQKRLEAIKTGAGVGSHLWKLLESIGVKHSADCSCLIWAELMNSWGSARCREARTEIVEHMKASAKSYGWATYVYAALKVVVLRLMFKISVTDPYGSLLDEAIRRTEIAEEHSKCQSVGVMELRQ